VNKLSSVEAFLSAGEFNRAEEILNSISVHPNIEKRYEALKIRISRSLNK
jgi:hypothetical protein